MSLANARASARRFFTAVVGACVITAGGAALSPLLAQAAASSPIALTFEGLQNSEPILNYYNGGTGGFGSSGGTNYGISFGNDALALNSGNFADNPSGSTIAFFLSGPGVVMNDPSGFQNGFSFYYSSAYAGSVRVYDGLNGTGNLLATVPISVNTPDSTCYYQTGRSFCHWDSVGVTFSGTAESVDFGGVANEVGFDNITIGSQTAVGGSGQDLTPPVVAKNSDVTVEATSGDGAAVTYASPSATDPDDAAGAVTCSPASGSTFPLGATTVTCSSTDTHGNTGSSTFNVTVQDTTAPVVTVPSDITAEATSAAGAVVTYASSATDAVSGSPATTCDTPSGSTFPLGTTKVTCSATDGAGNTGSSSFNVTVQDTTAPVVTVPSDITAEATSAAGAVVTYASSATDAVSGSPATTCDTPSGSTFPLGTTKVTCSATDGAGNTGSSSFNVTVQDTTAPVVTVPSDISTQATSASGAVVTFTSSATDAVSGSPATTCDTPSGSTFPLGTTQVTCSATDGAGNTGTNSFKVTVTYGFSGILQPVNADGSSIFKLGSTVPVKFALTGSSAGIANAVATLKYAKISNGIDGTSVEAVSTAAATTGNLFRYDPTSQQYIFNWSTKGLTAGSYRLTINLGDGVLHTVVVSLR